MLLMYIGGSAAGNKRPSEPSGDGWTLVLTHGKTDLNVMALYKWYGGDGDDDSYEIIDGKNTFVILSAIDGVDRNYPIVDALAERNTVEGKDGRAVAPSVFGVQDGATIGTYVFDDPQIPQLLDDTGFNVLVTSTSIQGADGMAAFVASTDTTGYTAPIAVAGSVQKGGGNDVAMTLTLRADGGPYDEPRPPSDEPTQAPGTVNATADAATASPRPSPGLRSPTPAPTIAPASDEPTTPPTTLAPTSRPTLSPTEMPIRTPSPSLAPRSDDYTDAPTLSPLELPDPTGVPTAVPTALPTALPSKESSSPTASPTQTTTSTAVDQQTTRTGELNTGVRSAAAYSLCGLLPLVVTVAGTLASSVGLR